MKQFKTVTNGYWTYMAWEVDGTIFLGGIPSNKKDPRTQYYILNKFDKNKFIKNSYSLGNTKLFRLTDSDVNILGPLFNDANRIM